MSAADTLDDVGSPAAVTTNGPRYYGFVVGASLPSAAAAERLMLAWDQGATLSMTSPISAKLEELAGRWLLDILDLPRASIVGFGTIARHRTAQKGIRTTGIDPQRNQLAGYGAPFL